VSFVAGADVVVVESTVTAVDEAADGTVVSSVVVTVGSIAVVVGSVVVVSSTDVVGPTERSAAVTLLYSWSFSRQMRLLVTACHE